MRDSATDSALIKRIVREYYQWFYAKKFNNLKWNRQWDLPKYRHSPT